MALPINREGAGDSNSGEVTPKAVGYSESNSMGLPQPPSSREALGSPSISEPVETPKEDVIEYEYSYDELDSPQAPPAPVEDTTPVISAPTPPEVHHTPIDDIVQPNPSENLEPVASGAYVQDEQPSFVDKKRGLLPFGGDRGKNKKTKAASDKFDARVDRAKKARVIQIGIVTSLIGVVAFGGYNALFPETGVSADQVNNAIRASQISNSFPTERAEAFGEHFVETYLTVSAAGEDPEHSALLSYFYTGSLKESSGVTSTLSASQVNQEILMKPKAFRSFVDQSNPDVINLTIGALVRTEASGLTGNTPPPTTGIANAKWVYFNVNVFYDRKVDAMAVTKDSPSLVPPVYFGNSVDLPAEKPLGEEENKELHAEVADSLEGFLKAFAESNPNNTSALTNYLVDDPSAVSEYNMVLLSGFNGDWGLSGEFDTAVQYLVYNDPNASAGKGVLIDANVTWQDTSVSGKSGAGSQLTVKSRYFIKMQLDGSKRWVVSWFGPRTFRAVEPKEK